MAKKKAKSPLQKKHSKRVVVKSRAYGEHTRSARGTHTPVTLNDTLSQQAARTAILNTVAKRVHDLLKKHSNGFKEAMLWQAMLSRMRKATTDKTSDLLMTLKGLELNHTYPLQRLINTSQVLAERHKKKMTITVQTVSSPLLKQMDMQYCYELILLLMGGKGKEDTALTVVTEWRDAKEPTEQIAFLFENAPKAKYYLACLHLMSGRDGKPADTLASRGMQVVWVGKM